MLNETNIKKFINFIISYIELLKLLKCLYTLHLFELAPAKVQDPNISEWCSNITKARNNWVIKPQELKTRENLTRNLQIMKTGIDSQLNFRKQSEVRLINSELLWQEFLVQIDHVFNLLRFNDFKELLLKTLKNIHVLSFAFIVIKWISWSDFMILFLFSIKSFCIITLYMVIARYRGWLC